MIGSKRTTRRDRKERKARQEAALSEQPTAATRYEYMVLDQSGVRRVRQYQLGRGRPGGGAQRSRRARVARRHDVVHGTGRVIRELRLQLPEKRCSSRASL